jgi:hypothetical protein
VELFPAICTVRALRAFLQMHAFKMRARALSFFLTLSLSPPVRLCRGIIMRDGLLLVPAASPLPPLHQHSTYFSLFPSLRPLRPQPPSSTAIGARQSIYIATRHRSGIGVARQRWKLGKKEAANRMAEEA